MYNCPICQKEHSTSRGARTHAFSIHGITAQQFFELQNPNVIGICEYCDKEHKNFQNSIIGYKKFCSVKCGKESGWKKGWDNEARRSKYAIVATERNLTGNFKGGRTKGSKNKNPYPNVTREYSEEYLRELGLRFSIMNKNRTQEEHNFYMDNARSYIGKNNITQNDEISRATWNSLNKIFNIEVPYNEYKKIRKA